MNRSESTDVMQVGDYLEKCELEITVAKAALAGTLELCNVMGGSFGSTRV